MMHEWVKEMSLEVKRSKRQLKSEQKKTKSVSVTSNRRLEAWRNLKAEVAELKDKLAECYGQVGLSHSVAVSGMQRNWFLKRPTTKKEFENKEVRSDANIISCLDPVCV